MSDLYKLATRREAEIDEAHRWAVSQQRRGVPLKDILPKLRRTYREIDMRYLRPKSVME